MEVCVDPDMRRLRIGQRLYDARQGLCEAQNLKGIVFGGRMPGLARRKKAFETPEDYLDAVTARKLNDPVIGFHLRAGFEPVGVLKGYLSSDAASMGHAAHMVWRNPYYAETHGRGAAFAVKETVRVATVQLQARKVASFEEFIANIEYFVDV